MHAKLMMLVMMMMMMMMLMYHAVSNLFSAKVSNESGATDYLFEDNNLTL